MLVYQVRVPVGGHLKPFEKPWASTLFMFVGMAFVLPYAYAVEALQRRRKRRGSSSSTNSSDQQPLLQPGQQENGLVLQSSATLSRSGSIKRRWRDIALLLLPTAFDLAATLLMSIGLLYVTASVYQMLRGAEMLFSALLSVTLLRRPLHRMHVYGLVFCTAGVTLVGLSNVMAAGGGESPESLWAGVRNGGGGGASAALLGQALIVIAQAVQAAQVVMEDYFLRDVGIGSLHVVGFEGVFGVVIIVGLLLPLLQHGWGPEGGGLREDSVETLQMLRASRPLLALALSNVALLALYNVAGMSVTRALGAVSRTVLETVRTLFVWLVGLALYYTPPLAGRGVGEPWTRGSWIQAAGFGVLVVGTHVYSLGDSAQTEEEAKKIDSLPPGSRWRVAAEAVLQQQRPFKCTMTFRQAPSDRLVACRLAGTLEAYRSGDMGGGDVVVAAAEELMANRRESASSGGSGAAPAAEP